MVGGGEEREGMEERSIIWLLMMMGVVSRGERGRWGLEDESDEVRASITREWLRDWRERVVDSGRRGREEGRRGRTVEGGRVSSEEDFIREEF